VRDALSIMDQGLPAADSKLTGNCARLVGSVGSELLEDLMGTVARAPAKEALRLLESAHDRRANPATLPAS